MATQAPQTASVTLDTPITIKVFYQGSVKKFQVPLKDLGINGFDKKLRSLLEVPEGTSVTFERFSDSAGSYVRLEKGNPQVYKTLFRAAKAKLKLRLRATTNVPYTPTAEASSAQSTVSLKVASSSAETLVPTTEPDTMNSVLKAAAANALPQHTCTAQTTLPSKPRGLEIRTKESSPIYNNSNWSVYCNACDIPMASEHYHCTKCDGGDYDLCQTCVNAGNHCYNEDHWLIKRFVKNGKVINSNTETFTAKSKAPAEVKVEPTTKEPSRPVISLPKVHKVIEPTRTCNACVKVYTEKEFVTCQDCDDYDLCIPCHVDAKHGHHPGHTLAPATKDTKVGALAEYLCAPGRNVRHAAVCDGCDKFIYGVRHKCLSCPDWDYCSQCHKNAKFIHANHRFVPIYDPLPDVRTRTHRHTGIYCDGPLCKDKRQAQYIEGVRYKCAVCNDTDFCANCEASPTNRHNRTHPLIMFKTPVRSVSITTTGEDKHGSAMPAMGDQTTRRSASTETTPVSASNASTQVQTVADLKPVEPRRTKVPAAVPSPISQEIKQPPLSFVVNNNTDLAAHYVCDSIQDGTKMAPGTLFEQTWTLRNPGPKTWLPGCSVRYVGGDNMLNVGDNQISTAAEISEATESNVLQTPVAPGQTMCFRVRMKAPLSEGVKISYWRLKSADGTPFGHRLWCHIEVAAPLPAVLPPLPSNVRGPYTGENRGMQDYQMQLMMLEQQNRRRLALNRQQQMADADALTRQHTLMRHQTLQQMRQTAAFIDNEYQRLLSPTAVKVETAAEKMPELAATPAAPAAPAVPAPFTYTPSAADFAAAAATTAATVAATTSASAPTEPSASGSQMIFPSLDKESPVSSTHEALAAPESPTAVDRAETETVLSPSVKSELEFFEDAETVNFSDEESFDDLATDDEYDILDASDQEA